MVCQLRLTRQSCQPEVHKLTPPSPDPSWRFAPPIRKLSVPILGTLEKKREVQYRRSFDKVDLFDSRHLLLNIFCSRKVTLCINIAFVYFFWHISSSQQETRSVNACTTWETWMWSSVRLFWGDDWFVHRLLYQSCKMRAKLSNEILPEEKRINCDSFGTKSE